MAGSDLFRPFNRQFTESIDTTEVWPDFASAQTYASGVVNGSTAAYIGQTVKWKDGSDVLKGEILSNGDIKLSSGGGEDGWYTPVLDIVESLPDDPVIGNRYAVTDQYDIAEWDGTQWVRTEVVDGGKFVNLADKLTYRKDGAEFVVDGGTGIYEFSVTGNRATWQYDKAVRFTNVVKGNITFTAKFVIAGVEYDELTVIGVEMVETQYMIIELLPVAGVEMACITVQFEIL